MSIGGIMADILVGCNALYAAVMVCKMRRARQEIIFIGIIDILLIKMAHYIIRDIIPIYGMSMMLFFLATGCEMLQIAYTVYKCQGEFWINMFFVMITVQLSSVAFIALMSVTPELQEILYIFIDGDLNLLDAKGIIVVVLIYAFAISVASFLMGRIYNHKKNSVIYKSIVLAYYAYSYVSGVYRIRGTWDIRDNLSGFWIFIINICKILPLLIGMYLLGYAHKKSENRRMKKEIELLSLAVAEHCSRYENLRKSNETLKQIKNEYESELGNYKGNAYAESLLLHSREIDLGVHTGGLIMDSALETISERLEKEDIKLEYTFEHSFGAGSDIIMSEMDMAYILDKLSRLAVMMNKNVSQDRFVVITERKISGAEVVKVEFSKDKKTKLKLAGNRLLADKLYGKDRKEMSDMMNEIHILVGKYDGVIHIEDEGATASVSIMAR
ncbi:MAG: hypothetical protein J5962_01725 [Lachnospiraceae bacterium]|nr:hypothetical protein [Lachnospiraceae bacterium]